MNNLKRRTFLKFTGAAALAGYFPYLYAKTDKSDPDVQILKRDDELFNTYRRLYNKRITIIPKFIAVCRNETGVIKAVQYATQRGIKISIKSGGHSFEGFSLIEDGMVIDVSNMYTMNLTDKNQLVSGPAARLAQMYGYCLSKKRIVPSGSCGTVGLSGITLGGGYGLFGRQFGLTCDYLTGLRMVDAQGRVIDTDDIPELLWACRGGGNGSFGVITQLRYDTVPAPKTLYQHRFRSFKVTPAKAVSLAEFWFDQYEELPNHAFSAFVLNGDTLTILLTSTEHDDKMIKILDNLDRRMDKNAHLKPDPLEIGIHYYYGRHNPLYFKNASGGFYKGFGDIKPCLKRIFTIVANNPGMLYQINTLGGEINNPARIVDSAYAHRDANFLAEAQSYWKHPKQGSKFMQEMKHVQNILYDNNIRQHYVNYPDLNIKGYQHAYYGSSYPQLQKLKRKLDPDNRFYCKQGIEAS